MDARDLLVANLDVVDRVIAFTCRRQRLEEADAEDFASTVKLKLIENDYAIVRKFEGRSSFATFLTVVVQRMLLDYRIHLWGKWHPSAEAKRLGEVAIELEKLLYRDGRTPDEAATILASKHPAHSPESVRSLAAQIPARAPKRKLVELSEAERVPDARRGPSDPERLRSSERVSAIVQRFIESMPVDDRLVMQLRFEGGMSVASIARSLDLDQKQLYRRMERHLRALREELERGGIDSAQAAELIGDRGVVLDFRLGNGPLRPSPNREETITDGREEVSR